MQRILVLAMIYFLNTRRNKHPIRRYLESHGAALAQRIEPMLYEDLLSAHDFPSGAYIFADIELLNDSQRRRAAETWQTLARGGCRVLNHPERTMRRYELLRALHERGANRFNVYRVREGQLPQRFPVFLRCENDHHGSRSRLLRSPAELQRALRWLRWFGPPQDELLLTEFCDTADAAGVYRKFSAFIVGSQILPRHLFFSRQWMVKSWQLQGERYLREEAEYFDTKPHERQLRQIFSVARVDYGRIDYSLLDGQIQTWEINTNPMIVASGRGGSGARSGIHLRFAPRMQKALEDFDSPAAAWTKAA